MHARLLALLLLLPASIAGRADESGFRLRIDRHVDDAQLTVIPELRGPARAVVRYEMASIKLGTAGRSTTHQGGRVVLDSHGAARLSTLRLGLGPEDRYDIIVTVFEGDRVVAEQAVRQPD